VIVDESEGGDCDEVIGAYAQNDVTEQNEVDGMKN